MDPIATGCLLAIFRNRMEADSFSMSALRSRWFVLIPCSAFLANRKPDGRRLSMLLLHPFINLALAVTIHRVAIFDKTILRRFLKHSARGIHWRPKLFHLPLAAAFSEPLVSRGRLAFPWDLMIAGVAAAGSYAFIERPALAIRKELEQRVEQRFLLKSRIPSQPPGPAIATRKVGC
jgi:hypothetical protein